MLALFDEETTMKNHDAAVERKGEKKGRKDISDLMNYLLTNGRSDDALKASSDETFLEKLLGEFRGGKLTAK